MLIRSASFASVLVLGSLLLTTNARSQPAPAQAKDQKSADEAAPPAQEPDLEATLRTPEPEDDAPSVKPPLADTPEEPDAHAELRQAETEGSAETSTESSEADATASNVQQTQGSKAPAADEAELDIVEVTAERRAPSPVTFELTTKEVRTLPGAFGDAFRAVGTLPGLTPIISGFPYYYVRGAPPGNVGYRYDGIDVPTLFHVAIGPSVLQPAFVNNVKLHPGGYDARLGQYSGGFVTADPTPGAIDFHGEAQIRIFDAGAYVETPIASGKGSIALGGRYSYTAGILSLVLDEAVLDYHDFQARLTYDLTPQDHLTVLLLGSYDLFGSEQDGVLEADYGQEFYRLSAIHEHEFADGLWRTQLTGGYDRSVFGFDNATRGRMASLRTRFEKSLVPSFTLRAGGEANVRGNETADPKYLDPDLVGSQAFIETFPSRTDYSAGLWVDSVWDATDELRIVPGVRADIYESQGASKLALEPRLRLDYSLTAETGLLAAVGFAHQPPSFAIPIGGIRPVGLQDGLQRTLSTSLGVKTRPWWGAQASAAVFYNRFYNMTDAFGASDTGGGPDTDFLSRAEGSAAGLELNFTGRIAGGLTGLVSYTLSRSVREVNDIDVYSQFDRTHVLNTALSYDFGGGYSFGARYLAYTGIPFGDDEGNARVGSSPLRARFFQRLDARFEKRWDFRGSGWMSLVVEGLNVTGSAEQAAPDTDGLAIVIPSIGVNGGF